MAEDFAHSDYANANRRLKAEAMVRWAEGQGIDLWAAGATPAGRSAFVKSGALRRASDETWAMAARLFDARRQAMAIGSAVDLTS